MNGQLSLDFETAGKNRKRFDEAPREHTVAGQYVGERSPEHVRDEAGEDAIAGAMAGAISGLLALDARRHHHVEPLSEQFVDHRRRTRRIVGRVAVHQHVNVGFDVVEHPPHDMAFALRGLAADHSAGCARHLHRVVGRIIVIDIDRRRRQRRTEIGDDLGNSVLFIVARHQDR